MIGQLVCFSFMCIFNTTHTVDGRNPASQLIWRIFHYLQGFIDPTVCTLSRECQAICSWISCTFEDSPSHKMLMFMQGAICTNQNASSILQLETLTSKLTCFFFQTSVSVPVNTAATRRMWRDAILAEEQMWAAVEAIFKRKT